MICYGKAWWILWEKTLGTSGRFSLEPILGLVESGTSRRKAIPSTSSWNSVREAEQDKDSNVKWKNPATSASTLWYTNIAAENGHL